MFKGIFLAASSGSLPDEPKVMRTAKTMPNSLPIEKMETKYQI
jgi:hypothetical protein